MHLRLTETCADGAGVAWRLAEHLDPASRKALVLSREQIAAPALGLAVGGPLVEWLGWRVVFVMQGTLSLLALALAAVVLREAPRQRARFDVLGAASATVSCISAIP